MMGWARQWADEQGTGYGDDGLDVFAVFGVIDDLAAFAAGGAVCVDYSEAEDDGGYEAIGAEFAAVADGLRASPGHVRDMVRTLGNVDPDSTEAANARLGIWGYRQAEHHRHGDACAQIGNAMREGRSDEAARMVTRALLEMRHADARLGDVIADEIQKYDRALEHDLHPARNPSRIRSACPADASPLHDDTSLRRVARRLADNRRKAEALRDAVAPIPSELERAIGYDIDAIERMHWGRSLMVRMAGHVPDRQERTNKRNAIMAGVIVTAMRRRDEWQSLCDNLVDNGITMPRDWPDANGSRPAAKMYDRIGRAAVAGWRTGKTCKSCIGTGSVLAGLCPSCNGYGVRHSPDKIVKDAGINRATFGDEPLWKDALGFAVTMSWRAMQSPEKWAQMARRAP